MNDSEKLKIATEALKKVGDMEKNSQFMSSYKEIYYHARRAAREALYKIETGDLRISGEEFEAQYKEWEERIKKE